MCRSIIIYKPLQETTKMRTALIFQIYFYYLNWLILFMYIIQMLIILTLVPVQWIIHKNSCMYLVQNVCQCAAVKAYITSRTLLPGSLVVQLFFQWLKTLISATCAYSDNVANWSLLIETIYSIHTLIFSWPNYW